MKVYRRFTGRPPESAQVEPIRGRPDAGVARWVDGNGQAVKRDVARDSRGAWRLISPVYSARVKNDQGAWREVSTGLKDSAEATAWAVAEQARYERIRAGLTTHAEENRRIHGSRAAAELIEEYLSDLGTRATPGHVKTTRTRLNVLARELNARRLSDFTAAAVNRWSKGRITQGAGRRSINGYVNALAAFFSWAREAGVTDIELRGLNRYRENEDKRRPRRAFTREEAAALLSATPEPGRVLIYSLALQTGLRRKEIKSLEVNHVQDGFIVLGAAQAKNRREARIPITPELAAQLGRFIGGRKAGKIFKQVPRPRTFDMDLKRAGIVKRNAQGDQVDFHALRKTFITWLLAGGTDTRTVQALARHSDIKLTTGVYTDENQLPTRAAAQALGAEVDALRGALNHSAKPPVSDDQIAEKQGFEGPAIKWGARGRRFESSRPDWSYGHPPDLDALRYALKQLTRAELIQLFTEALEPD